MSDKIKQVTDASYEEDVLESDLPVIVDFWAPWCGPCLMMAPLFEELARKYDGRITFAKMNCDENPNTPGELGILGIPTSIMYLDGEEVDRTVGFAPKEVFERKIEAVLDATAAK